MAYSTNARLAAIILLLLAGMYLLGLSHPSTVAVPVLLTDPPRVPAGTQAIVVSYSSVMVHTSGTADSGWHNASGSGTVDLLGVVNSSKVMAIARLDANSTVNLVRFNITSAYMTLNGTRYVLALPGRTFTVSVAGAAEISRSSGVLVDFTPSIVPQDGAAPGSAFMLVPAAKAVVIGNVSAGAAAGIGNGIGIDQQARAALVKAEAGLSVG